MNKRVNKVRKATGRAEAITAGRQQNSATYNTEQRRFTTSEAATDWHWL